MHQLEQLIAGPDALTGPALQDQVLRAAFGLSALGVRPGDCVAILMRNDLPQVVATLAAQHLGAYPVQVNWHAASAEVRHVLADCGARLLVGHTDLLHGLDGDVVPAGTAVIACVPHAALVAAHRIAGDDLALPPGALAWAGWLAAQKPIEAAPAPAVESIIYTSGTTGLPKGVRRFAPTPQQAARTERMRLGMTGIDAGARVLVPAPLYHTAPNLFALRAVRKGALVVLPARFEAAALLADIERHRITHLYAVPTMFVRLLGLPQQVRERHDLSSLAFVLHAGGPCAPSVKQGMLDWWGPIIHEYYGSTEAGPSTFVTGAEWLARPGTVGRPIDGVQLEIQDEAGQPVPTGQVGEVLVRNDGYADFTYLNRPEARAELQRGELLQSGDLGWQDAAGYLYLVDRKRDLVISGGVNIYPAEIEAAIQALPGVADCAVFGIPDEEFSEALAAVVEPAEGAALTAPQIRAQLEISLARFKVPRLIEITAQLPREASGKIKKRLLREPYWRAAGRSI